MKKITLLLPVFLITLSLGGISHVANACSYSNGGAATAGDDTINCTDTVADSSVDALAEMILLQLMEMELEHKLLMLILVTEITH